MNMSPEDFQFGRLVQTIAPGSKLLRTWSLAGGISAAMTALEVERPDGRVSRMIVRQPGVAALRHNPNAAADEYGLLQATQSLGLATPAPLYLDQSGSILSTPFLVIDYIDGRPEFAPTDVDNFVRQLATHLARIHRVDGSHPALAFLPKQAQGLTELVGERPARLDESFDEARIRGTLDSVWPWPQRNAPALLHGDYWPGNLLWRNGRLVAVIDWEDARVGDPLIDFAISRLDVLWICGVAAFESFTRHYQSLMAIDDGNLPYWDLCAALRLVRLAGSNLAEWAAFFQPFGRYDITTQTMRTHYQYFVAQAYDRLVAG